jgi:hypothetical protein
MTILVDRAATYQGLRLDTGVEYWMAHKHFQQGPNVQATRHLRTRNMKISSLKAFSPSQSFLFLPKLKVHPTGHMEPYNLSGLLHLPPLSYFPPAQTSFVSSQTTHAGSQGTEKNFSSRKGVEESLHDQ